MTSGVRAEFLWQLADVETKVVVVAEAFSEDRYSWRPADDVRSVSEVFMHIAGADIMLPSLVGGAAA